MDEIVHKKGKIYYSIGEVAEMFDVNASLIRFWEKKFDIIKPHKNKKGNRLFTPQDVDTFKLIYHLVKERGMTLAGAQKRLKDNKDGSIRDMEIVDRLLSIRAMLLEIREELKQDGEIFSPEGYLDEDDNGTDTIGTIASQSDKPQEDDIIVLTDEVRTEVVTDGSSPWEEPEEEPAYDETERSAALEELRNVKDILAGWDDEPDAKPEREDNTGDSIDTADIGTETSSEATKQDATVALGNIFDDELDNGGDYADPWEEVDESTVAPLSENMDNVIAKQDDLFGTDACTTFSPDDMEAAQEASEEEEPKKPMIYEQTLF